MAHRFKHEVEQITARVVDALMQKLEQTPGFADPLKAMRGEDVADFRGTLSMTVSRIALDVLPEDEPIAEAEEEGDLDPEIVGVKDDEFVEEGNHELDDDPEGSAPQEGADMTSRDRFGGQGGDGPAQPPEHNRTVTGSGGTMPKTDQEEKAMREGQDPKLVQNPTDPDLPTAHQVGAGATITQVAGQPSTPSNAREPIQGGQAAQGPQNTELTGDKDRLAELGKQGDPRGSAPSQQPGETDEQFRVRTAATTGVSPQPGQDKSAIVDSDQKQEDRSGLSGAGESGGDRAARQAAYEVWRKDPDNIGKPKPKEFADL